MYVVFDANIYISAFISPNGAPAKVVSRWLAGEFDVLVSQPIVDEILRVTNYDRIQKKYARVRERRLEFVTLITKQGIWVEPITTLTVVSVDESDNRYIECAVTGNAQYIVSGDKHLLDIGEYQGIVVVTPSVFSALLDADIQ